MISPEEIDTVAGVSVTSRLRTVIDLLRFSESFGTREIQAIATLMIEGVLDYSMCANSLLIRRNLPQKRIALERLALVRARHPQAAAS